MPRQSHSGRYNVIIEVVQSRQYNKTVCSKQIDINGRRYLTGSGLHGIAAVAGI